MEMMRVMMAVSRVLLAGVAVVGSSGSATGSSSPLRCGSAGSGDLEISIGSDRWVVAFSAAGTSADTAWEAVPGGAPGSCELRAAVGESYSVRRQVAGLESGRGWQVTETFTNLHPDQDIALWFDNNITSGSEPADCEQRQWNSHVTTVASSCIDVGGRYNLTHSGSFGWMKFYDGKGTGPVYNDPPFNPSIYVRGARSGLGAVPAMEDDWLRRQLRIHKRSRSAFFGVHAFGVPANKTVDYTWTLLPTANSTDYYDFINIARAETVPAYQVGANGGAGAFVPDVFANDWSTEALKSLLSALAIKTAVICGPLQHGGAPWLGNDAYCNEQNFNLTAYLQNIASACRRLKSLQPGLLCLAPFETALSPCQIVPPGSNTSQQQQLLLPPAPVWPDAVVITAVGAPAGYDFIWPQLPPGAKTLQYIYAPHKGNSYAAFLTERVQQALTMGGMDGFYMDFFDYAMSDDPARQFRYTYNLTLTGWDGRSVDPGAPANAAVFEPPPPPLHANATTGCMQALATGCAATRGISVAACDTCTERLATALHKAGCTSEIEQGWCSGSVTGPGPRKVGRYKADLNWLTTPARVAAVDAALASASGTGQFVANGNAAGDSSPIRHRPIMRFWEGCLDYGYTSKSKYMPQCPSCVQSATHLRFSCDPFVACFSHDDIDTRLHVDVAPQAHTSPLHR
jgi:hypothetical protein